MNIEENKRIMAKNIRRYMDEKGITNQQLCEDLGFKYTTFMDWIKAVTYPRIGKVELMANYFGCEKSDLIEDKKKPTVQDDGITEKKKALIDFASSLSEEQAALALRLLKSLVEAD